MTWTISEVEESKFGHITFGADDKDDCDTASPITLKFSELFGQKTRPPRSLAMQILVRTKPLGSPPEFNVFGIIAATHSVELLAASAC